MDQTTITGIGLLVFFALLIAAPAAIIWELRRRLRRSQAAILAWRQRAEQFENELNGTVEALNETQRKMVNDYRRKPRPMPNPPVGLTTTRQRLNLILPEDREPYAFPIRWEIANGQPGVVGMSLYGDSPAQSGHIMLTGETGSGKSGLAFQIMATICLKTTPAQFRIFIIDPKENEGAFWVGKAHTWREPILGEDVVGAKAAMQALHDERVARQRLNATYKAMEWEQLPLEVRPPMLLVYISELDLLESVSSDLEDWLKKELTAARSSGIRYLIDSQTVANRETRWRNQLSTYIAGFQSSRDAIRPNVGLGIEEIEELGGVPPHKFTAPGYFTVRQRRDVASVRAPKIDRDERLRVLLLLPDTATPLPAASPHSSALQVLPGASEAPQKVEESGSAGSREAPKQLIDVSSQERADIIAAAKVLSSRRQVSIQVFKSPGGSGFKKVKRVCDEEGLLMQDVGDNKAADLTQLVDSA